MPEQFIKPLLLVTAVSMLAWIVFWVILSATRKNNRGRISLTAEFTLFVFYIYITAVLTLTVVPLPFSRFKKPNKGGINVIPLVDTVVSLVKIFLPQRKFVTEHTLQNTFGNIILFIPLGIFLPMLSDRYRSLKKVVIFAVIFSASIELIQLFSRLFEIYRFVDIDDVILNTCGAAIGFTIVNKWYFKNHPLRRTNLNIWN